MLSHSLFVVSHLTWRHPHLKVKMHSDLARCKGSKEVGAAMYYRHTKLHDPESVSHAHYYLGKKQVHVLSELEQKEYLDRYSDRLHGIDMICWQGGHGM